MVREPQLLLVACWLKVRTGPGVAPLLLSLAEQSVQEPVEKLKAVQRSSAPYKGELKSSPEAACNMAERTLLEQMSAERLKRSRRESMLQSIR